MPRLPASIQQFVEQQKTLSVSETWKDEGEPYRSAYGNYWYRAVGCMLLSGRIKPKANGEPNMTDTVRLCKEANFNQYLLMRIARLFLKAQVVAVERRDHYVKGPGFTAWWDHDVEKLTELTHKAFLAVLQEETGYQPYRPTLIVQARLIEFLKLFFHCFLDRALPEVSVGPTLQAFSELPKDDLLKAAKSFRIKVDALAVYHWHYWLDEKGHKAMLTALNIPEWVWYDKDDKTEWVMLSPLGAGMLGLKKMPPVPDLYAELKVLPNNSVLAGPGRDIDSLVPLFRYCKIKRINQVYEFQVDRKHLAQMPVDPSPTEELRKVLEESGPLPATVADAIGTKSKVGGTLRIRGCSALVKADSAEVLDAIRQHPKLKGYLEPGAPAGYLLIKPSSDWMNFVRRCEELGFQVKPLESSNRLGQ